MNIEQAIMSEMPKNKMLLTVDFLRDNDMDRVAKAIEELYNCWDCFDSGTITQEGFGLDDDREMPCPVCNLE